MLSTKSVLKNILKFTDKQKKQFRSSRPEVFLRKGVLKICCKFLGEHPYRSVVSINLLCNFIDIALQHGCSPVNLLHIFRTPFPTNTSGWLLLAVIRRCSVKEKMFLKILQNLQKNIFSGVWRCSVKQGALKNFANFTGNNLCWSLFLIKLHSWLLQLYHRKLRHRRFLSL